VLRQDLNFKCLHLTQFTVKIGPSSRTSTVRKAWEKGEITKKWQETTWAKKITARKRVS
jgi:large subunit ribosomal protein L14e